MGPNVPTLNPGRLIMCRWLAYSGPPVQLSDLLSRPDHSLIDQSRHARQNVETTNGDGFGVGWYGEGVTPGVYRDTHPAWTIPYGELFGKGVGYFLEGEATIEVDYLLVRKL